MALLKCKECGGEVSSKAAACQKCGAPLKQKSRVGYLGAVLVLVVIVVVANSASKCEDAKEKTHLAIQRAEQQRKDEQANIERERQVAEENKREAEAFNAQIETHYQSLSTHHKAKNYDEAIKVVDLFRLHNKAGYKDVEAIGKAAKLMKLEAELKILGPTQVEEKFHAYKELYALNPENKNYKRERDRYSAKVDEIHKKSADELRKNQSDLELISWHWSNSYDYVIAEGQVKNISNKKLERVEALVTFYDVNGNMITSDSSIIQYSPLLPGQVSPFKVMERYNPAMKRASIDFKFLFGGSIPTYQKQAK
jgi:hypothetical protein